MKRLVILIIMISALTVGAQNVNVKNRHAILRMLDQQQQCWNNGDINAYMSYYWNSDSLKFITKSDITTTWKQTFEMYKKHYPNKEAMGTLFFEKVEMFL